jgi:hypothetical protein
MYTSRLHTNPTRSLHSTKGRPDGVCFNNFFEINTVSYLILLLLLLLPTKIPVSCFNMEKSSLADKTNPTLDNSRKKKRQKRDMRSLIVFRTRTKKTERDEQENGVGDIIDQPTNKIKRRGSH